MTIRKIWISAILFSIALVSTHQSSAQIHLSALPNTGNTAAAQVAVDSIGNLYYGTNIPGGPPQQFVFRYNPATQLRDTLARLSGPIAGLELGNRDSVLYFTNQTAIRVVNLATGTIRTLFDGYEYPAVLRMRRKTGELYAIENGGDNGRTANIGKYNIVTGQRTRVAGGPTNNIANGYVNGVGDSVRFNFQRPNGDFKNGCALVFSLNEDTLYIGDAGNRCIRKLDLTTNEVTTYAGPLPGTVQPAAFQDGYRSEARFASINGLAIDSAGFLYVADNGPFNRDSTAGNRIRKIAPGGRVYTLIGTGQGRGRGNFDNQDFTPGIGTNAKLGNIQDLVFSRNKDTLFILQTQRINRAFKRPSTLRFSNLQNRFVGSGDFVVQTTSNSRSPIQISAIELPNNVTFGANTVNIPSDAEPGRVLLRAVQAGDPDSVVTTAVVDSFLVVVRVGTKLPSGESQVLIAPNPSTNGKFTIVNAQQHSKDFSLHLKDITGKKVPFLQTNEPGKPATISMENRPGIYLLTVILTDGAKSTYRIAIR